MPAQSIMKRLVRCEAVSGVKSYIFIKVSIKSILNRFFKEDKTMLKRIFLIQSFIIFICITSYGVQTHSSFVTPSEIKLQLIYSHLASKPLLKRDPRYAVALNWIDNGEEKKVAEMAISNEGFINSTARIWASKLLSKTEETNLPLNDSLAFVIGSVRDNLDARLLLTGDYLYIADPRLGMSYPEAYSNTLYELLDSNSRGLSIILSYSSPQWKGSDFKSVQAAGLLTTRGWAEVNYSGGTNRRAVEATLQSFLCQPITSWKEGGLPDFRVRRDIDRAPAGNPGTYQKECRSCHASMDGLAGAFAFLDFSNSTLVFRDTIASKYLQNAQTYPEGYVSEDHSWINLLATNQNDKFGFKNKLVGYGVNEFGQMLSESDAFAQCMVKRTYSQICGKELDLKNEIILKLSTQFKSNGYRFKSLFADVAIEQNCFKE